MEAKTRLSKVLARRGVASRRKCETLILSGQVKVKGQVITTPQFLVPHGIKQITCQGKQVPQSVPFHYYIINKPVGYICSHRVGTNQKSVFDLLPSQQGRLFTIGRLDKETEGLLLVTNDGHFAQKTAHPSSNLPREYIAKVQEEVEHHHLCTLGSGMEIEEVWIRPKKVKKIRKGTIKIVVKEGKKREVRCLIENAGLTMLSLKRVRIGGLHLAQLSIGQWREMSLEDKKQLFNG